MMTEFVGDFETLVASGKTVVVDFFAEWCGPCKMVAPAFEKISTELSDKASFVKVNIDESEDLPAKLGIRGIPTFLVLKDGKEVARVSGAKSESDLREWITKNV